MLILRMVPEPPPEEQCPEKADRAEQIEALPPGHEVQHEHDQQRREGAAPAGREPHQALSPRPILPAEPVAEGTRQIGKTARLPQAKEETTADQRRQASHPTAGRGEEGPPANPAGERPAGAETVREPAAGDLKESVGNAEDGERQSHLLLREPQIGADQMLRLRDAHAIDVENGRQGHGKDQQHTTGMHRILSKSRHGLTSTDRFPILPAPCGDLTPCRRLILSREPRTIKRPLDPGDATCSRHTL